MSLRDCVIGEGDLANGKLESISYDKPKDRFVLSFSTAVSPSQIYTVEGKDRELIIMHTEEKILGLPEDMLSPGRTPLSCPSMDYASQPGFIYRQPSSDIQAHDRWFITSMEVRRTRNVQILPGSRCR